MQHPKLLDAIAQVDVELAQLKRDHETLGPNLAGLTSAWAELIKVMAPEPAPEVRICPTCRKTVMRAATLCGFCWTKLAPAA